ncbi:MAG TPA: TraR/DksA family transcriptional regulator [Bryobacteraceae bacterium]|nr:TraR/DksA family transcriptional regulator [Bryobacteraceae bacterium]
MNQTELTKYKNDLGRLRQELMLAMGRRDDILVESQADPMDESLSYSMREMAVGQLNRNSETLRKIEEALERMKEGSYGLCEECEESIPAKRLNAIPWSSFCVSCQERHDLHSRSSFDPGIYLSNAA